MAEEEKNQEELAKEWEEALKAQSEQAGKPEAEDQEKLAEAWAEALGAQGNVESSPVSEGSEVAALNNESQIQHEEGECDSKFELLKDIPLEISVEVGSTRLPLEEIIKLHANSVVELDRFIDEPVDIKINGKLVAKGKLFVVKDSYGVEITQIITPQERMKLIEE
jgi:flagellar motor switch protein FliN/FliY